MLKRIEKPNLSGVNSSAIWSVANETELRQFLDKSRFPYVYWDAVKHWKKPGGNDNLVLWNAIKLFRRSNSLPSVVLSSESNTFWWMSGIPQIEKLLHEIDMQLGNNIFSPENPLDLQQQHELVGRGIMEEAIASSQLEGAHTSRKLAKQILREERKPANRSEQMIVNNYSAMQLIESDLKNKPIDEEMLFLLHRTLTANTLDDERDVGRYRVDKDNIVVSNSSGEIYHIPPKATFVKKQIRRLIAYANNELLDQHFCHPVIKAIILHFWVGYLHPFVDGNGRFARALFYWYLLKEGYWAIGYLPLSTTIKKSPAQYRDAYIYTEQDDNDLTYFIAYNVSKISQAMQEVEAYVQKKSKENATTFKTARSKYRLNERQIQLLRYYGKNSDATTSATTYAKVYAVTRLTAMKDLKSLAKLKFVVARKNGKSVCYYATKKVLELLG